MAVKLRHVTVTVGAPPAIAGREGRPVLAEFYGALLGMDDPAGHPFCL